MPHQSPDRGATRNMDMKDRGEGIKISSTRAIETWVPVQVDVEHVDSDTKSSGKKGGTQELIHCVIHTEMMPRYGDGYRKMFRHDIVAWKRAGHTEVTLPKIQSLLNPAS